MKIPKRSLVANTYKNKILETNFLRNFKNLDFTLRLRNSYLKKQNVMS